MKYELAEYGLTAYIQVVTPAAAKKMLQEQANPKNRNISQANLANYSRMMRNGDWMINGEAVVIQSDGIIANGHNRLSAIVQSGVPVEILFIIGVSPDAFTTYDSGQTRRASHVLQMADIPNSTNIAALVSSVIIYRAAIHRKGSYNTYVRPTNLEILAEYNKSPQLYQTAYKLAARFKQYCPCAHLGMVYAYALIDKNHNYETVEMFAVKLASGEMMSSGDPIFALRESLIRASNERKSAATAGRSPNWYKNACVIAWNAHINGRKLTLIKVIDANKAIEVQ